MFSAGVSDPCRRRRPWGFKGPKLGWGLFLAYYLGQYRRLHERPPRCTCNADAWFAALRGEGEVPLAELAAPALRIHRPDGSCEELAPEKALGRALSTAGMLRASEGKLWLDGRGEDVVARRGEGGEGLGLIRFGSGLVTDVWLP